MSESRERHSAKRNHCFVTLKLVHIWKLSKWGKLFCMNTIRTESNGWFTIRNISHLNTIDRPCYKNKLDREESMTESLRHWLYRSPSYSNCMLFATSITHFFPCELIPTVLISYFTLHVTTFNNISKWAQINATTMDKKDVLYEIRADHCKHFIIFRCWSIVKFVQIMFWKLKLSLLTIKQSARTCLAGLTVCIPPSVDRKTEFLLWFHIPSFSVHSVSCRYPESLFQIA